jgi:hypothetical protein
MSLPKVQEAVQSSTDKYNEVKYPKSKHDIGNDGIKHMVFIMLSIRNFVQKRQNYIHNPQKSS